MLTPKQYRDAVKAINKFDADLINKEHEYNAKEHHIQYEIYQPKIRALENKRDTEIKKVREELETFKAKQEEEKVPNQDIINETKEILSLMDLSLTSVNNALAIEVYSYQDKDEKGNYYKDEYGNYEKRKIIYKPIDTIVQDQYKNIQVFIVRNQKPVNKYTLTIQGISLLLNERRGKYYINGIRENSNIRQTLKEAPTIEALQKWYNKNKAGLLKDFLVEHVKVEEMYEEAKALYKKIEWKVLFIETWRNNHTHRDDDEWNDYTAISNTLSKNPKDLALLVGQMKTEDGKTMLARLFKEQM